MKKKFLEIYPTVLFGAGGFIALSVGTILNLIYGAYFPESIIPYTNIITPIINGTCALLCLVFIFSSKKTLFSLIILGTQSIYSVLTGYELLGMFHFF